MSTPEHSSPRSSLRATNRPTRVLACVLCQQRKVKCDRRFPCANCVRAQVQCVPATQVRRRRRFPERELLESVRRYEDLLRQNNIQFQPLRNSVMEQASSSTDHGGYERSNDEKMERDSPEVGTPGSETKYEAKNFWRVMNQMSVDPEEDDTNESDKSNEHDKSRFGAREAVFRKAWEEHYDGGSQTLLFGARKFDVKVSTLHPSQVEIFRLWQIYLDNVNPLLKVTHTPTLQARIIDAAADVANITPTLEALMFSIYCLAILSLSEDECRTLYGSSRDDLLKGYQFACQQALLNCEVLRTSDRDCLTALYLYLISVRHQTDPRSLSPILSVAIRIALRMGIHSESSYSRCTILEGEMRRRLWWSLVLFDNRICEMADHKATNLLPTWDCKIPLNVNDFDLQPEMKTGPATHGNPSEALFVVVRSELGNFVRRSSFHLDFTNPALKTVAKENPLPAAGSLPAFERMIEENYFASCNPENPLHFMTIWTTRGHLAKNRLLDHYARYPSVPRTETQRDAVVSHALRMLECDTKLMNSPLTKGYQWFLLLHFPFPAYFHIAQDLKRRPTAGHAERSWAVLNDNYAARFGAMKKMNPFFEYLARVLLQAWEAREAVPRDHDKPLEPPHIVSDVRSKMSQGPTRLAGNTEHSTSASTANMNDSSMSTFIDVGGYGVPYGLEEPGFFSTGYPSTHPTMDFDLDQPVWATVDWHSLQGRDW
ncbi:hypothetical protein IFM58399_01228 [Aspergillus lentulus]|uniref:Zn(2)-C6 fungal-type domain-containing protein n=1 Tax=Aspergillus lentulus TaxID=293939 RepID=A0ABQ0ZRV8_ASPLE|nr:uncharacterized protein IFM58399_01228 [Aspergillus lentulus]GFF25949.1 hypothetical protein IFM58399_01228 [Aspergillus lentulus]GFF45100.1 hypothetical protein IFM62136_00165 [Aspergillus lentulus]GFF62096.1 hypothetical protein IFM60648_00518 [Aspergillus lentulus]